jgi:uncharacterized FAD-dependent dehydrogenase
MVAGLRSRSLNMAARFATKARSLALRRMAVITGVELADGTEIKTQAVVLACGHSARDTYAMH